MKQLLIFSLFISLVSCVKNQELTPTPVGSAIVNMTDPTKTFDATGQKLLYQGSFMSNVHTTSGTAKVYDKDGKKTLVLEQFVTDAGPDLRIYTSEDKTATKFTELSTLSQTGNFYVEIPATTDITKQKFILIWCKQFSVLFGNSELK